MYTNISTHIKRTMLTLCILALAFLISSRWFPVAQAQGAEYNWVISNPRVIIAPDGYVQPQNGYHAVQAGIFHEDGTPMYICRSGFPDGVHSGKLYKGQCYVPWGGKEHIRGFGDYEVLFSRISEHWTPVADLEYWDIQARGIPTGFVRDGSTSRPLFACVIRSTITVPDGRKLKTFVVGHPGKYDLERDICYIPWGGDENGFEGPWSFEILMRN